MKTSLDYRNDFLCVLSESEAPDGLLVREWYPIRETGRAEVDILCGCPSPRSAVRREFTSMKRETYFNC